MREYLLEQVGAFAAALFDGADGSTDRKPVSVENLLQAVLRFSSLISRFSFPVSRILNEKRPTRNVFLRPQQLARDHHPLYLAGPFPNRTQLRIAPILFSRIILDEAVTAVNLDRLFGDAHSHFACVELRHR